MPQNFSLNDNEISSVQPSVPSLDSSPQLQAQDARNDPHSNINSPHGNINPSVTSRTENNLRPVDSHLYENRSVSADRLTRLPSCEVPTSTRQIKPLNDFLGQERARSAIQTALTLSYGGYNIFAAGPAGLGKRTMIERLLKKHAAGLPTPQDWVYLNNFENPREPRAVAFAPGEAVRFKKAMHQLWQSLYKKLEVAFSATTYRKQIDTLKRDTEKSQQQYLQVLTQEAETLHLMLVQQDQQHRFVALRQHMTGSSETAEASRGNAILSEDELHKLTLAEQRTINTNIDRMNGKLQRLNSKILRLEEQLHEKTTRIAHELAEQILLEKTRSVRQKFGHVEGINAYLDAYSADVIENIEYILAQEDEDFLPGPFDRVPPRYQVNVISHHRPNSGAPIVYVDLPTHFNLLGHVEQLTQMGTITTDFTLIRGGALHQANGGFLLIEAEQILEQPYAWQGLKRALRSQGISMSSLEQMLTLTGSISLAPQPIPLNVKVVLLGEPDIYYELMEFDPELNSLFKIRADFIDSLKRTAESEQAYLQLISDYVQKEKLLHFDQSALGELLVDSSRQAEDQSALSLHASSLGNLLREANTLALQAGARLVTGEHVRQALRGREWRLGYLKDLYWEDLQRGTQLIETRGWCIGQINALSVLHYADSEFGLPARLTASVYYGHGEIIDVERSVDLGGSIHAKAMLIMSNYLKSRFGREQLLQFGGAVAFEQSYMDIDGDSATLAQITALLSAISGIPVNQALAVTGSMNQLGMVQPVGGVNAKIEGFFSACKLGGLTGNQGVVLPAQNLQHLMLSDEVLEAVRQGQFHIYQVEQVEDALALLMGVDPGQPSAAGKYPRNTLFGQVQRQMRIWQHADSFGNKKGKPEKKKKRRAKISDPDKKSKVK